MWDGQFEDFIVEDKFGGYGRAAFDAQAEKQLILCYLEGRDRRTDVKTYLLLNKTQLSSLPAQFQHDDVRFSEGLVERFLREFTQEGDVVFDPFAGYGTTLLVAEAMGRIPYGIEIDGPRVQYVRSLLKQPENVIHGDARRLASYGLPPFDFSITSPPYMGKNDPQDPLTGYSAPGNGYAAYLQDLRDIYTQVSQLMKPAARVVIEVANLKGKAGLTTLAWDIAGEVLQVLPFEGEVIVCWDQPYGYGYDHSYCLIYTKP